MEAPSLARGGAGDGGMHQIWILWEGNILKDQNIFETHAT